MRRRGLLLAAILLFALVGPACSFAQERTPQPYTADEFPEWLKDLRRAEIVFVGSFPITLFVTLETYDVIRYINENYSPTYLPWPLGAGAPYTNGETPWLAASALSLSLIVAGIDFLLGRLQERASDH